MYSFLFWNYDKDGKRDSAISCYNKGSIRQDQWTREQYRHYLVTTMEVYDKTNEQQNNIDIILLQQWEYTTRPMNNIIISTLSSYNNGVYDKTNEY